MNIRGLSLLGALAALTMHPASATTYHVIHTFLSTTGNDLATPIPEMVKDSSGRLYGTTQFGGQFGYGGVFRLTPPVKPSTVWTEEVLYSFDNTNGADPKGGVLIGPSGELYGTTNIGGLYGAGTVWRLDPAGVTWTLTTLHDFNAPGPPQDGYYSIAGLAFGPDGRLYGTTTSGGPTFNGGIVFAIDTNGTGYEVLHNFGAKAGDGIVPYYGRPIVNGMGVFGTTSGGGAHSDGIVYWLKPPTLGGTVWKETVLHSFGDYTGDATSATQGLSPGSGGTMFGCSTGGGAGGVVYEITKPPSGSKTWGEQVIYTFTNAPGEPVVTECVVVQDGLGRLFGTSSGGGDNNYGSAFELTPPSVGQPTWTETILHSFGPTGSGDGLQPISGMVAGKGGTWYGTTYTGGTVSGYGTVYSINPL